MEGRQGEPGEPVYATIQTSLCSELPKDMTTGHARVMRDGISFLSAEQSFPHMHGVSDRAGSVCTLRWQHRVYRQRKVHSDHARSETPCMCGNDCSADRNDMPSRITRA